LNQIRGIRFQGGFAKCYELRNLSNGDIVAGKIVPKSLLVKQNQREKMAQEITLHRQLSHRYVVKVRDWRRL
jgi:polo-like kinase 1